MRPIVSGWILPTLSFAAVTPMLFAGPQDASTTAHSIDWSAIRAAREAACHRITGVDGEFEATNPGQGWSVRFDERGVTITPSAAGRSFGLELASYGFERARTRFPNAACSNASGQRFEREWDSLLTEWYVNDARGLEHGLTLRTRPEGSGELVFTFDVRSELEACTDGDGRGVRFVESDGECALSYSQLVVLDASGKELPARIAIADRAIELRIDESGALYPITIDPILQQQAYLKAFNPDFDDEFGESVDMSGDTIVVSARLEDSNGTSPSDDSLKNSGAAYVFIRSGTTWSQQAYLKASTPGLSDQFANAVGIDGDTIVIGAYEEDSNATGINGDETNNLAAHSGAAYVFVRSGTVWTQQAYLKASNSEASDEFGVSVGISGDTIVVGAPGESSNATGVNGNQTNNSLDNAGAAYVFVRSGTTWSQQAYLKGSNVDSLDIFGVEVAISGDTAVIGAPREDSNATGVNGNDFNNLTMNAGAAYVFVRSGTTWSQQAYLKASNTDTFDEFGRTLAISGDTIVAGALGEDSNATGVNGNQADNSASNAGAAYVFLRNGTAWSQQAYLKASNTQADDNFAQSIDVGGDRIIVGAPNEDSDANGVNGNQADNSLTYVGAAYVFWRAGVLWSQQAYVKASNSDDRDFFGWGVAFSNDDIVVGASGEDSSANTVNGDQNDNSLDRAGAAYVFVLTEPYTTFCSGDGSLPTPCPCTPPNTVPSPPAAPGHGCANSLNLDGAILSATGTTSPDTLKLTAHVAPVYVAFALLLKGNASASNGVASSDGIRCVDGALLRFGSHFAGTNGDPVGQWSYPNAVQTTPISTLTLQTPAQTAYYQLFYRNAAPNFCTSATANWSSGIIVPWP